MRKFLTLKNLYTLMPIALLYLLFLLLFLDILKGRAFSLGITTSIALSFLGLVTIWSFYKFFAYTKNISNSAILAILISSVALSLLVQKSITVKEKVDMTQTIFENPLYMHFIPLANKYGLDLSFAKKAWEQRDLTTYKINHIFHQPKNSIDIIFFGDSSISWGLIPQVIEQLTNKKVAMYAYESNFLTKNTTLLFDKISRYYLKDDGIVIFSFDNKNLQRDPKAIRIYEKEYYEILKWEDEDFEEYTKVNQRSFYDKYISFDNFKTRYTNLTEYLKINYYLSLKSPSIYRYYIEKIINPELSKSKIVNGNEQTKFIRWDERSVTQFNPKLMHKAIHNSDMPTTTLDDNNTLINATASSKIYGKQKLYIVSLSNNKESYIESRKIYYSYYQKLGFVLCDLGVALKDNRHYTMQTDGTVVNANTHMANMGGMMKSILIGQWLKRYFDSGE